MRTLKFFRQSSLSHSPNFLGLYVSPKRRSIMSLLSRKDTTHANHNFGILIVRQRYRLCQLGHHIHHILAPPVCIIFHVMILRRCCFLRWGAMMTLIIAWSCNHGSRVFVVGVNDLEQLGHCQKSGCRSSPNQVVSQEKYSPPMPNQRESREEISPSILLAEFALFFGLLMIASHGHGPVCRSTQRALIAAKEALSLFGGRTKRGTRVWTAGVRTPFVSTGSVMSLGSLVDLIGTSDHPVLLDDSERSADEEGRAPTRTTTNRMGGRQPATRRRSYSSSSDFSTGSSSCDSGSSIGGSDIATAPSPTRSQKRRSIDDGVDSEVGSIMSKFLNLLRRSRRREKKDPPSYGGGSLDDNSLQCSIDRGGITGDCDLRETRRSTVDSSPRIPKTPAPRRLSLDVPKGRGNNGGTTSPHRHQKLRLLEGPHHNHKPTSGYIAIRRENALRLSEGPHCHHKPTSGYAPIRTEGALRLSDCTIITI